MGVRVVSRASLLKSFIERKIRRDLIHVLPDASTHRAAIAGDLDPEVVLDLTFEALERVAAAMTAQKGTEYILLEDIEAEEVSRIFSDTLGRTVDIVPVLLNSVLVTTSPRVQRYLRVGFALRVLQEYFLAASLVRNGAESTGYPSDVVALATDISRSGVSS